MAIVRSPRTTGISQGRRALLLLAAAAALLVPDLQAQTVKPLPGATDEGEVDYVGRYGEVFRLRAGWQIVPFMSRGTEVVNVYPKYDPRKPDYALDPFKPKSSDFRPENFTALRLIQLMIIPRSRESGRALEKLKRAKIADLNASGVRYDVIDDPFFPAARGGWPKGTFEIKVTEPYLLTQLYTETPLYTCILTAGIDTPPSVLIGRHYDDLRYGLAAWIAPQERPAPDERSAAIVARGISLHPFTVPAVWMGWAAVSAFAILLVLLGKWTRRDLPGRVGASLLLHSNAGGVLGGLVGLAFWPFAWSTHHFPVVIAVAGALQPVLLLALRRARGAGVSRRALTGSCLWCLVVAAVMGYYGSFDWGAGWSEDRYRYLYAFTAISGFVIFAVGGIIAGLLDAPAAAPGAGSVALALIIALVLPSRVRAQSGDGAAALAAARAAARNRLRAGHVTKDSYKTAAIERLTQEDGYYDYQRVEIRGILSPDTADNETNSVTGPIFDKQIAPTHLGKGDMPQAVPGWVKDGIAAVQDLASLNQETKNEITSAAETAVTELKRKEVNEIVAHSWGTEIVYNAILSGDIRPPRRLIVCGMPDMDLAKWRALSKYTGTEVVVYTDSRDPAAGAARRGQQVDMSAAAAAAALAGGDSGIGQHLLRHDDAAAFERQWLDACARIECNPHDRRAPDVVYNDDYDGSTHDRFEYYGAMQDNGDLPKPPLDESMSGKYTAFPGSAAALKAAQDARIAKQESLLLRERVEAEAQNIVQADEAAKSAGDVSFYDSAAQLTPLLQHARDAFPAQEAAAVARWHQDPEYLAYRAHMIALEEEARARDLARQKAEFEAYQAQEQQRLLHFADMKNRWEYMRTMTGLACADPDALERAGRAGQVPGVAIGDLDLDWEMSRSDGPGRTPAVNACQRFIMAGLRSSPDLVRGGELLAWARRYREMHPSLARRFTAAIGDMFSAMGNIFSGGSDDGGSVIDGDDRPRGRESTGQSDADREQWKRSWEAQERDEQEIADAVHEAMNRHSPDNWSSLNQLRGIASR